MPIRIYSLAKELKIDSKDLVDICARAGITGKGSALASLTDDELTKVKAYLSGGPKKSSPQAPIPPSSPSSLAAPAPSTPPILPPVRPAQPAPPVAAPKPAPVAPPPAEEAAPAPPVAPVVETPPAPTPPPAAPPVTTAASTPPSRGPGAGSSGGLTPFTRDDYIAPLGTAGGKPRVINSRGNRGDGEGEGGGGRRESRGQRPQRREPVVRLGAIPEQPQTPVAKRDEPAPQKPIMTLPVDAIRNAKSGSRAPLEQFTKHQDKR
ncbi:MAG: translation initiation factor IF-2 N-terminal domain-containing protein, partial [Planctomycetales bacterium]|nr:translation initiation factor IF-2 N-terminal domain-containing protein [Planctomycetales bacterium]